MDASRCFGAPDASRRAASVSSMAAAHCAMAEGRSISVTMKKMRVGTWRILFGAIRLRSRAQGRTRHGTLGKGRGHGGRQAGQGPVMVAYRALAPGPARAHHS